MAKRSHSKSTNNDAPTTLPRDTLVTLESVLCTEELHRRPSRPADYEKENRALVALARTLAESPQIILQAIVDTILELFDGDSAGISLLTKDERGFYWPAIAGLWKPHLGGGTPRDFGPCGDVLDRNAPLLFRHFERRYTYFLPLTPPAEECLMVPLYIKGKAVGTIWAITHNDHRKFDAEDLRQLVSVGRLASTACDVIAVSNAAQDSRRAALNVMEDAVQSRRAMETLNMELRVSEERFRALFDSIDEGFCIIEKVDGEAGERTDFRYIEVNPAFGTQSGLTGVIGKTILQVVPGEAEEWSRVFEKVHRTGEPVRFERALVTTGRMLELYAFLVQHETHRRVAVIFKDITARKQAEAASANLAAIVESSDDAIFSQDLDGFITSWNAGAERLFQYTAREAMDQGLFNLLPVERSYSEFLIAERVPRALGVKHHETVIRRKDGILLDISVTVSPVSTTMGQIVGASTIARDISAYRKAAEALRESDHRKDEFLAMLAHELRNPLAPIRNALEIIRRSRSFISSTSRTAAAPGHEPETPEFEAPGHPVDSAVNVLDRQVGQLVRLIDDLLDANRISRGKIELRLERVDLSLVVQQVVEAIRPVCESQGLELAVTLPQEPVYLDADPTRLAQILGNLLNNASKFTDPGGRIGLTVEREAKSSVVIRVRDTGIGIAADELPHVFEMFTQAAGSLEKSPSGLGIGLALVRTLARMHGGAADAHSAGLGQGAEFVVRLPTMGKPPSLAPRPTSEAPSVTTALRILVVDDSQDAAESLAMLLRLSGHETHLAFDGLEAVEAAARLHPDVILLDIGLPKLNGYEAARRIREQQRDKRPVLVALTGWGKDEDRRRSKEAGFDAHIVKPMDYAALGKLLVALGAVNQQ